MEILKRLYIVILVLRLLYALDRGTDKYKKNLIVWTIKNCVRMSNEINQIYIMLR